MVKQGPDLSSPCSELLCVGRRNQGTKQHPALRWEEECGCTFGFQLLGQVGSSSRRDVIVVTGWRWAAPWPQLMALIKLLPVVCSAVTLHAAQVLKTKLRRAVCWQVRAWVKLFCNMLVCARNILCQVFWIKMGVGNGRPECVLSVTPGVSNSLFVLGYL